LTEGVTAPLLFVVDSMATRLLQLIVEEVDF
jgi:hypothetical protein